MFVLINTDQSSSKFISNDRILQMPINIDQYCTYMYIHMRWACVKQTISFFQAARCQALGYLLSGALFSAVGKHPWLASSSKSWAVNLHWFAICFKHTSKCMYMYMYVYVQVFYLYMVCSNENQAFSHNVSTPTDGLRFALE